MSIAFPLVDVHNHLIPGVDDGARTLDDSLAALRAMREQGVRRLVATPHLNADGIRHPDWFGERMERVDTAWDRLHRAAAEQVPEIELARGHEILLDVPDVRLADPRTRLGGGRTVLVEFPHLFVPAGSVAVLAQLRAEGWLPIVAHPERYLNTNVHSGDLSLVEAWRRDGARMAINAGSLLGGFGPGALATVRQMLELGWVDLVGSDFHARPARPLVLRQSLERLREWGGEEQAELLFSENPGRALDGAEQVPVPPLRLANRLWSRVRQMFVR